MDALPPIPQNLIDKLEEIIPERCASLSMSDREIWFYAGKRELVRILKDHYESQNQTILDSKP
jgi:hypothetical protein